MGHGMNLTDREKDQLKAMIDAGRPLPPPYKADLFDQRHEAESAVHAGLVAPSTASMS